MPTGRIMSFVSYAWLFSTKVETNGNRIDNRQPSREDPIVLRNMSIKPHQYPENYFHVIERTSAFNRGYLYNNEYYLWDKYTLRKGT